MTKLNKGNPVVFWPSSICDTFPENPDNKRLDGSSNFKFEFEFTLNSNSTEQQTVLCLLPRFTGIDIYPDKTIVTITFEDKAEYYGLGPLISPGIRSSIIFDHRVKEYFKVFINNIEVVSEDLSNRQFGLADSPHIIFGSGNFPKNDFNLNYCELDLHSFKIWTDKGLTTDHDFNQQIFDKYVDLTGNLNFVHKL